MNELLTNYLGIQESEIDNSFLAQWIIKTVFEKQEYKFKDEG